MRNCLLFGHSHQRQQIENLVIALFHTVFGRGGIVVIERCGIQRFDIELFMLDHQGQRILVIDFVVSIGIENTVNGTCGNSQVFQTLSFGHGRDILSF